MLHVTVIFEPVRIEKCTFSFLTVVQLLSCVCPFATPWTAARQASLSFTISQSLLKFMSIGDAIQLSHPLSSPSPPAFNLSQHQALFQGQFFASGCQSIGASASVLPMNIRDWSPLGLNGLISLQSKKLSRVFPNTTVQKHQFFSAQLSLWSNWFLCSSDGKESACNAGDSGSIPGSERLSGEGNGNPLQYSCLKNSMDRGAWRATVCGVAESDATEWLTLLLLTSIRLTTGKTIALTIHTFVRKVMSLLFNMLSRFVIAFFPREQASWWLHSPSTVILEPKKIKYVTDSTFSPSIWHEVMGPDTMILVFWLLSFRPAFSLSFSPSSRAL